MKSFENARPIRLTEWDHDGLPTTRPVADWPSLLQRIASGAEWAKKTNDADCADRLRAFARHCLRFARPDGTPMFTEDSQAFLDPLRSWAELVDDRGIQTLLDRLRPPKGRAPTIAPPPLPAFASEKRALAILRPDWAPRGDWIAVDQRRADTPCLVELRGGGEHWIGAHWGGPTKSRARLLLVDRLPLRPLRVVVSRRIRQGRSDRLAGARARLGNPRRGNQAFGGIRGCDASARSPRERLGDAARPRRRPWSSIAIAGARPSRRSAWKRESSALTTADWRLITSRTADALGRRSSSFGIPTCSRRNSAGNA